jgi:hypothetical protein
MSQTFYCRDPDGDDLPEEVILSSYCDSANAAEEFAKRKELGYHESHKMDVYVSGPDGYKEFTVETEWEPVYHARPKS